MKDKARVGKWRFRLGVFFLLLLAAAVYEFRLGGRLLFIYREWRHAQQWKARSLWLPDYRLALETRVDGVKKNLSGLTWNGDTHTLFAITNSPTEVVELSTAGMLLRRIKLTGFSDTEALEYIGDGNFIIAEEQTQTVYVVSIDESTTELDAQGRQRFSLGMGKAGNWGLEGLAWDFSAKKLYAAKERRPVHIYEVSGFPHEANTTLDITVTSDRERDGGLFVSDVSGLDFEPIHGHLLVLSDASKIIIEVDKNGEAVSSLSLVIGHGLTAPVPQPEGIALDGEKNLYVASEPNLLYVFTKP